MYLIFTVAEKEVLNSLPDNPHATRALKIYLAALIWLYLVHFTIFYCLVCEHYFEFQLIACVPFSIRVVVYNMQKSSRFSWLWFKVIKPFYKYIFFAMDVKICLCFLFISICCSWFLFSCVYFLFCWFLGFWVHSHLLLIVTDFVHLCLM